VVATPATEFFLFVPSFSFFQPTFQRKTVKHSILRNAAFAALCAVAAAGASATGNHAGGHGHGDAEAAIGQPGVATTSWFSNLNFNVFGGHMLRPHGTGACIAGAGWCRRLTGELIGDRPLRVFEPARI